MAALNRWGRDTAAGLRTNPACVSMMAQGGILGLALLFAGVVWAALWLAAWHLLLSAAPFVDRLVRKHWLVGPVTPHPRVLRQGGRLGVWGYVGLHWAYAAMYGLAAAWLWVNVGNVSGLGWALGAPT
jgi:hypothetical protein